MLFQTLKPLATERPVHLLLSVTEDGRMRVYIEPGKDKNAKDKELTACISTFSVCATPQELDDQFPAAVTEWLQTRTETLDGIQAGLKAAKANLEDAAKTDSKTFASGPKSSSKTVAASRHNKAAAASVQPPQPSLVSAENIGSTSGTDPYPLAVGSTQNGEDA